MTAHRGRRPIDDLVLQLKGLIHVRALLEDRGASTAELAAHSREIVRVRSQLERLVRSSAA